MLHCGNVMRLMPAIHGNGLVHFFLVLTHLWEHKLFISLQKSICLDFLYKVDIAPNDCGMDAAIFSGKVSLA